MKTFTDTEKRILEATKKCYKWIARDKNGTLAIYKTKPIRYVVDELFDTENVDGYILGECFSDNIFSNVTWENSPIQFRNDEPLTHKEREYLKFVFRPFASHIAYVRKLSTDNSEFIGVYIWKGGNATSMLFPDFKKGTMFKGMNSEKPYSLKELGIDYDE